MVETGHAVSEEHRAKRRATVMTEVFHGGRSSFRFGKGENICEGGMRIKPSQMPRPEAVINVRFILPVHPKATAVEVQARVIWTERENSTGVQFLDLKEEYREAIAKFVEGA